MKRYSVFATSSYRWQIRRRRSSRSVREKTSRDTTTEYHHDPPWGMRDRACQVILATSAFFRSIRVIIASIRFRIILETERERERGAPSYFSRVRSITSSSLLSRRSLAQFFPLLNPPRCPRCFSRHPKRATQFISMTRIRGRVSADLSQLYSRQRRRERERETERGYVLTRYSASFILLSRDSAV
jgi:hypothetical protein